MCTVRLSAKSTHCPGASSDAAVRNIDRKKTTNMRIRELAEHLSHAMTPAAARSVGGICRPDA